VTSLAEPQPSATPAPRAPSWLAIPRPGEIHHEPEAGPCGCDASRQGAVYTLHFDPPYKPEPDAPRYKWASHYTGWAKDPDAHLDARLAQHEAGQGARLTQVQREAGGSWRLASVEPGDRSRERQLKQHSAARRCPICRAEAQAEASPRLEPEPEAEAGL
jgi:predicted GIY-YIG superfamily endonuclease